MKSLAKKAPFLFSFAGFAIGYLIYEVSFSGENDLLNKVIVEWGWCAQGSASCLLRVYVLFSLMIIVSGFVIQVAYDWIYKRNFFKKSSSKDEKERKSNNLSKQSEIILASSNENGEFEYLNDRIYKVASLKVFNNTNSEITRCYATLQAADDIIFGTNGEPGKIPTIPSLGNFNKPDRIKWNEFKDVKERCEITIPPKDSRHLDVADTLGTFHYNLCGEDVNVNYMSGSPLHTVQIRLDYLVGAEPKFLIFNGYIYSANHMPSNETEIKKFGSDKLKTKADKVADQIQNQVMIFRDGDWKNDKDVQKYLNTREGEKKKHYEAERRRELSYDLVLELLELRRKIESIKIENIQNNASVVQDGRRLTKSISQKLPNIRMAFGTDSEIENGILLLERLVISLDGETNNYCSHLYETEKYVKTGRRTPLELGLDIRRSFGNMFGDSGLKVQILNEIDKLIETLKQ